MHLPFRQFNCREPKSFVPGDERGVSSARPLGVANERVVRFATLKRKGPPMTERSNFMPVVVVIQAKANSICLHQALPIRAAIAEAAVNHQKAQTL
jgi:hypothetical protein